jgi:hypothetical protein
MPNVMPSLRQRWQDTLLVVDPTTRVLELIQDVVRSHNEGALTLLESARALLPLYSHPLATAWPDAELTSIAIQADLIVGDRQTSDDDRTAWDEIQDTLTRALAREYQRSK